MYRGPYTDVENGYIAVAVVGLAVFLCGVATYFDPGFFTGQSHVRTSGSIYGSLGVMIVGLFLVIGAALWEDKVHEEL